jgi:hypothetical protein
MWEAEERELLTVAKSEHNRNACNSLMAEPLDTERSQEQLHSE